MSPPARRRGSKLHWVMAIGYGTGRLPRGGVDRNIDISPIRVAQGGSPPARRRGSKPALRGTKRGPWQSPPARRRGSKLEHGFAFGIGIASPPARRRGSKPFANDKRHAFMLVASRAEAWIETGSALLRRPPHRGRLPRGGVDRNLRKGGALVEQEVSPPARRRGSKRHR